MAQVTIDYSVRFQVLRSSLDELQKVLNKLEPNSSGFNKLQKVIQNMRTNMEDFQIQTSKAFTSQQQFTKADKTLDKLGDNLMRISNVMGGLKFKDIKLTDDDIRSFRVLEQQLEAINQKYLTVKDNFKQQIFSNNINKELLDSIDVNLITKDLEEITRRVQAALSKVNKDVYKAREQMTSAVTNQSAKEGQINSLLEGGISEASLGQELYNRFFEVAKNGITRFKSGAIKSEFLAALKSEFQLSAADIKALTSAFSKNSTAEGISHALTSNLKVQNIFTNALGNFRNRASQATTTYNQLDVRQTGLENLLYQIQAGYARDDRGQGVGTLARAMDEMTDSVTKNSNAMRDRQQESVRNVQADQNLKASSDQLRQGISSLSQQLSSANAEFLRLQQVTQTVNSIKYAITNFMGFNQVLNLTRTAVREALNHIKQLDTTMNGIAIVSDMTTEDLWKQIDVYSQVAQKYGTTIQGAYEVSKIYYQAGYETNEVLTLMNETLKLSKVSGLDYAKATDYMMTA